MASRLSFRGTKVVATLGPASASSKIIEDLLEAGVDAVRLNFSHGDHASHARTIRRVRKASRRNRTPVVIIQDLQGPRFRISYLPEDKLEVRVGDRVRIAAVPPGVEGPARAGRGNDAEAIAIQPLISFRRMKVGQSVLVGDEGITLVILSVKAGWLSGRVVRGGKLRLKQGVNFPQAGAALSALGEKDLKDIKFGIAHGVDYVALSFVRSAQDVLDLRRRLRGTEIGVISKIETQEAIRGIDDIIDASDAILVARGDLAREVSMSQVPVLQKFLIERCNRKAKPVITATQMLESMMTNPQPTRAEATDVANAVLDGSDALMLSGETAAGKYPVEAVRMMVSIICDTEKAHEFEWIRQRPPLEPEHQIDETIAYLAADAARTLGASAIITFSVSGRTALRVAKFRPTVPVFAVTTSAATRMKLGISHGTIAERIDEVGDTDSMIASAVAAAAQKRRIVKKGDIVVITAGVPPYIRGKTNLLKIEVV